MTPEGLAARRDRSSRFDLATAKSARLRTFRALSLLDAALYLDTTLRWELGAGFARPAWLGMTLAVVLPFALLNRFFESKLLHGVLAFPLWCWAFMMAGTGNPHFDWHRVPVVDFFRTSWLDYWLTDGGFWTAGIAATAHAVLAPRWLPRSSPVTGLPARWAWSVVSAALVAACVALLPVVDMSAAVPSPGDPPYVVRIDPRDPSGVAGPRLVWLRRGAWALLVMGGLSCGCNEVTREDQGQRRATPPEHIGTAFVMLGGCTLWTCL